MIAKALVSVLALLVSIGLLVGVLEWVASDQRVQGPAQGSRPVHLQRCVEPCLVP